MKRHETVIVALILSLFTSLFLFFGCSSAPDAVPSNNGVQYAINEPFLFGNEAAITIDRGDRGGSLFYLVSRATGKSYPLCYDPLCNHQNDACPAALLSGSTLYNMACDGTTLYYAYNPSDGESMDETKILSVNLTDASRTELLALSNRIFGLKYDNGSLYFIENNADTTNRICGLEIGHRRVSTILDGADAGISIGMFCVWDGKLLYTTGEQKGLFRYDPATGEAEEILTDYVTNFFLAGARLFVSGRTAESAYVKLIDDGETRLLDCGNAANDPFCVAGTVFYGMNTEVIPYTVPLTPELLDRLGNDAEKYAARSYRNTELFAYDFESGEKHSIGIYERLTVHALEFWNGTLYLKGTRVIDLGEGNLSEESCSAAVDPETGALTYIRYGDMS